MKILLISFLLVLGLVQPVRSEEPSSFTIRAMRDLSETSDDDFVQMEVDAKSGRGSIWVGKEILLDRSDIDSVEVVTQSGLSEERIKEWKKMADDVHDQQIEEFRHSRSMLDISFNTTGRRKLEAATGRYVGKNLAITLNRRVLMSPVVRETISSGVLRLDNQYSKTEAEELAREMLKK